MQSKIISVLLFLTAAGSIAYVLLKLPFGLSWSEDPYLVAASMTPLLFLFAGVLVFFRPRFSYGTGLIAGFIALPWFLWTEFVNFKIVNSWIALNFYDHPEFGGSVVFSKSKILAVAGTVVVIVLCTLRLLPARWKLRNLPIYQRTWPAFAVCLLVLAVWFCCAATPYRIPVIVDGISPDLAILRVEKQGLQFHETRISVWHDRTFSISHNNRKLLRYRFAESNFQGILPETTYQKALAFSQSPGFKNLHTAPPKPLRTWNAEGWYVRNDSSMVLAFTSEYGTEPPKELMDLFQEIKASAPTGNWTQGGLRDVCLGFCYDPTAGLGIVFVNGRCRTDTNGTRCE
jgi:hypothetical protein